MSSITQLDGSEKLEDEYKMVAIVSSNPNPKDERKLKEFIVEKKYDRMVEMIDRNFINYVEKILPKYFSQAFNTDGLIENYFRIYFGVDDTGDVIGFPVSDTKQMTQMIHQKIEQTFVHIIELSLIKWKDAQIMDSDIMYVDESRESTGIETSYTCTYSKSYTNHAATMDMDRDIKDIMEKIKLLNIDISLTPVNKMESYSPELQPELDAVVKEYEEKISCYNDYKAKKDSNREKWLYRSFYVKSAINTILNTERRYEFLLWLKYEAPKSVPDIEILFPDLPLLIIELEKKTNDLYTHIDPDYRLLQTPDNIVPDKRREYNILKLVTLYRDIIGEQLRGDAHLYKMEPMTPPPNEPYTSICSCYIGSVMNDIGKTHPLYVCSITITDIKNFLKNIKLKHFYYENDAGIPICQIRKIDIVSGKTLGPISVDKML